MKNYIFALVTIAVVSINCSLTHGAAAKDSQNAGDKSWANFVAGKTTAERWSTIAKTAPNLLGMTRADVEKALGKGTFSEKQEELMYLITDDSAKTKVFDNIVISFNRENKVKSFVIVTKAKD